MLANRVKKINTRHFETSPFKMFLTRKTGALKIMHKRQHLDLMFLEPIDGDNSISNGIRLPKIR